MVRNKARLVAKSCSQSEGIDYDETFVPIARLEAIRLFLAYKLFMRCKLYHMDAKSAFLNRVLDEEVYAENPPGAWYGTLSQLLIYHGFKKGKLDRTLFWIQEGADILLV